MVFQKKYTKTLLAWVLLIAMIISMLPTLSFAKLDPYTFDGDLYLYYDFEGVAEGVIPDLTGNGRNATAIAAEGAYEIIDASIGGNNVKAISIDGTEEGASSNGAYIKLPDIDLSEFDGITVSCWLNLRQQLSYQRIWDIGADGNKYLGLTADGMNTYKANITESSYPEENCESTSPSAISLDEWFLATVTFDNNSGSMKLYKDGELDNSATCETKLNDIGNAVSSYIGRSQFSWDKCALISVADFRIYNRALTDSEVAKLAGIDEINLAESDLKKISITGLSSLTENITLPTEGENGSIITWTSSEPSVLSDTGVVTRPESDTEDVSGILTAYAENGTYTATREFEFTVRKKPGESTRELYLHYDFDNVSSTIIPDVSGGMRDGRINQDGGEGFQIIDAEIYGETKKALSLTGGDGGSFVELPNGLLEGVNEVTVSCWVKIKGRSGYQRIWDFGNGTSAYMYLLTDGGNDGFRGYTGAITNSGWSREQGVSKDVSLEQNKWIFTTVTYNDETHTFSLYEDGVLLGQKTDCTPIISDIGPTTKNWIGYGQFGDAPAIMDIADFRIYNYELNGDEIRELCGLDDEDYAESDKTSLNLGDLSGVTENISLPSVGNAGSTITWESSNTAIANDGTVTRPTQDTPNATGILIATITYGEYSTTREFDFTVIAMPNDLQIVEHDLSVLDLGDLSAVRENISLPSVGEWGSAFTWKTKDPAYISDDGEITRPAVGFGEKEVNIVVTATSGTQKATKSFTATILPQYSVTEIESYDPITVTTKVGILPTLPDKVTVTYTTGEKAEHRVRWYAISEFDQYVAGDSFQVEGLIFDKGYGVFSTVEVSSDSKPIPSAPSAVNFDLSDISLDGDNILTQNANRAYDYLKLLDDDRMLYNFRNTFGVDTKGAEPLGGWDAPTGLLRGHSTGHYISALALAYASSGDAQFKDKLDYMIDEMRTLQLMAKGNPEDFVTVCTKTNASQNLWSKDPTEWGEGYISAYAPDHFALLEQKTPYATIWAPYYTLHKIMAGFIDAYTYGGNETALEIAKDLGLWVYRRLDNCTTPELRTEMWDMYIAGEYGGMNESMARLYNITGNNDFLECAKLFDNTTFFGNLAKNVDDIGGRHANQHIPQIVGAVQEYIASGEEGYYHIADNFWNMVISRYMYSVGGVGQGENFRQPYQLAASIDSDKNCETCAAYNMLKLTKELNAFDPENAKYMDYYERTLLNQIAGSQNPNVSSSMHHGTTYMYPIGPGAAKTYGGDYNSFTCCHGTGMENHVKYQEAAYYRSTDDSTLYVGLYMPSTLDWENKGVTIQQECEFPASSTKFTVNGNGSFDLKLRVPYWATDEFTVKVNGEVVVSDAEPSTYVSAGTEWKDGDVITVSMPFTAYIEKTPDKLDGYDVASIKYGPLVMSTQDSSEEFMTLTLPEDINNTSMVTKNGPDENNLYTMGINGRTFIPIYSTHDYIPYHTYFYLETLGAVVSDVDKAELYEKLASASNYKESDYTTASYASLLDAINAAAEIYRKADATSDEVTAQISALDEAIKGLVRKTSNKGGSGSGASKTNLPKGVSGSVITPIAKNGAEIVSGAQVKAALANMNNNKPVITVNLSASGDNAFEKAAVKNIAAKDNVLLEINQGDATLTFSSEALDTISDSATGDITFTAQLADKKKLTPDQLEKIGDRPVYDLSVTSNGAAITDFNGNVTISLKYTLQPGENPNGVIIYYVDASGNVKTVANSVYDSVTGTISWTTDHFSLYMIGYNYVSFTDIVGHWSKNTIEFLASREFIHGVGNGLYQPNRDVTRAEFIKMVHNVLKLPETAEINDYTDVVDNAWYFNAVMAAKKAGLLKGISMEGNNLMPNKIITREEMAVILANATVYCKLEIPKNELDLSSQYSDASDISKDFLDEVEIVVKLGLMVGGGAGEFNPSDSVTRAQAAQVQKNILEIFK